MVNKYTFATRAFKLKEVCVILLRNMCFAVGLLLYACASLKTFRIRKQGPRH